MILYECGTWFLKITIVSKNLNTHDPNEALEELFLNKYDPAKLTGLKLLNLESDFLVAPALGKDRIRAKYVMSSGLKKLEWANTHVPENERVSGFPDLYLDMHIEAFRELAKGSAADSVPTNDIGELIAYVNLVIKAGYLPEFIMKQYHMVMIVRDDMKLDFEGYEKFTKDQNNFSIEPGKHYYLIRYPEQK
ncbi:hypothetical protein [Niabella hibiscisoli]|uniref:hypothetical protein n=1 Tax=Niabella hibiscisoli TaxID=1825928 RepID=UPI001F0DD481|nr:hypothetical protein [Niabella hibiscisoli]MCH5720552.1 hypothetical protein [Niabella hibiscisoli]